MTHEERAKRITRIFYAVLFLGILAGVYFYPKPVVEKKPAVVEESDALKIDHYHLPSDPASEQIADVLNKVQKKYDKLVLVSRIDVTKQAEEAKAQGVNKAPHVIFRTKEKKVYEFQGVANQSQVERKLEEILRGLKRIDKDWRPHVEGMQPAAK